MKASEARSGKGHHDENFPVASFLVPARHRAPILAFYRFARTADDVADHPDLAAAAKLALLGRLEQALAGGTQNGAEEDEAAVALRLALHARNLAAVHPVDLLSAFRQDVTKSRYADWAELMDYCDRSAAPVGRFVLDVHGESPALWPMNDALCAALQVINHVQDCGKDLVALDRCYLPADILLAAGADIGMLRSGRLQPELRLALDRVLQLTSALLDRSEPFAAAIVDRGLSFEVAAIQRLARTLVERLRREDMLAGRVALSKLAAAGVAARAVLSAWWQGRAPMPAGKGL